MKDPNDNKKWIIDEVAASVVQKIFELCVSGYGPAQIRRWLIDNKIYCPSYHLNQIGFPVGRVAKKPYAWTIMTIGDILERVEYLGHTVNFKTSKPSYKSKRQVKNAPDKWVIFENTHPAIIDERTFQTVQNLRKHKKRPTKSGEINMFSGLVRCGNCGSKMYLCKRYKNEKQDYFTCGTHKNKPDDCKRGNTIRLSDLETCISESIRSLIDYVLSSQPDFITKMAEQGKKDLNSELKRKKKIISNNRARIDKIDTIIKSLYIDKIEGNLSDERFRKMTEDFEAEQAVLTKETETLEYDIANAKDKDINIQKFIDLVKKYRSSKNLTATLLNDLIDHMDVYPKDKVLGTREITIHYKFIGPFTAK